MVLTYIVLTIDSNLLCFKNCKKVSKFIRKQFYSLINFPSTRFSDYKPTKLPLLHPAIITKLDFYYLLTFVNACYVLVGVYKLGQLYLR